MKYPIEKTKFDSSPYDQSWYERDYFISKDGVGEFPLHHCKTTYQESVPYITQTRNAVDIGCRDGEFTRYLQHNFDHVFCFDYRRRKLFHNNVNLSKVTHFKCGLAEANKKEYVSGGGSMTSGKIPKEKYYETQLYTLDEFNLPDVDYIKIDVDGYELKVLQGSMKTIKKYWPLIVLEQENKERAGIEFCEELGYELVAWCPNNQNAIMRKPK